MTLFEKIQESRDIKEKSINAYITSLKKIHNYIDGGNDFDSLKFLASNKFKEVLEFLDTLKLPTRKNYIAAILVALSSEKSPNDKLIEKYRNHLDILAVEYNKKIKSHEKSEKLEKNWVSMKELLDIVKRYKREIKERNLDKKDTFQKKDLDLYQKYLVGSLYTILPPLRNDYANMKVITFKEYENIEDKKNNYLVIVSKSKKFFSFGAYKTSEVYGIKTLDIPRNLNNIINKWLERNKTGFFLINTKNEPLSENGLTKFLYKTFEDTGKNISSTIIRHVYLSDKYKDINEEKAKDAAQMLHSVGEQDNYIKS
mgnify:FL=1